MAQATREPQGYPTKDAAQRANDDMWRTFKKQFQEKPITYGTILVLFGFLIGAVLFHYQPSWGDENNNLFGYLTNFATEILGVVFTIFVVNEFQKRRDRDQLARELIAAVKYGGPINAQQALSIMRSYDDELGWYRGEKGLLAGVNLFGANLEGVDLSFANLSRANLCEAVLKDAILENAVLKKAKLNRAILANASMESSNLDEAELNFANLEKTNIQLASLNKAHLNRTRLVGALLGGTDMRDVSLWKSDLSDVSLIRANLQGADLGSANLAGTLLWEADFSGANLWHANLKNAEIIPKEEFMQSSHAIFSAETNLPDSDNVNYGCTLTDNTKRYDPEAGLEQMLRYTDPTNEDFWNPCEELDEAEKNKLFTTKPLGPWWCDENIETPF